MSSPRASSGPPRSSAGRQGVRDLHREGRHTARARPPRAVGGDARHVHVVHRDDGDGQPRAPHRNRAAGAASTRSTASRWPGTSPGCAGGGASRTRSASASSRRELGSSTSAARSRRRPAGTSPSRRRSGSGVAPLSSTARPRSAAVTPARSNIRRRATARRPWTAREGPGHPRAVGEDARHLVQPRSASTARPASPGRRPSRALGLDWLAKDLWGKKA